MRLESTGIFLLKALQSAFEDCNFLLVLFSALLFNPCNGCFYNSVEILLVQIDNTSVRYVDMVSCSVLCMFAPTWEGRKSIFLWYSWHFLCCICNLKIQGLESVQYFFLLPFSSSSLVKGLGFIKYWISIIITAIASTTWLAFNYIKQDFVIHIQEWWF